MDKLSFIVVIVCTMTSALVTVANFVFNYLKDRKRKEERAWDSALQLLISHREPSQFVPDTIETAEELTYFEDAYLLFRAVGDDKYKVFSERYLASPTHKGLVSDLIDSRRADSQSEL